VAFPSRPTALRLPGVLHAPFLIRGELRVERHPFELVDRLLELTQAHGRPDDDLVDEALPFARSLDRLDPLLPLVLARGPQRCHGAILRGRVHYLKLYLVAVRSPRAERPGVDELRELSRAAARVGRLGRGVAVIYSRGVQEVPPADPPTPSCLLAEPSLDHTPLYARLEPRGYARVRPALGRVDARFPEQSSPRRERDAERAGPSLGRRHRRGCLEVPRRTAVPGRRVVQRVLPPLVRETLRVELQALDGECLGRLILEPRGAGGVLGLVAGRAPGRDAVVDLADAHAGHALPSHGEVRIESRHVHLPVPDGRGADGTDREAVTEHAKVQRVLRIVLERNRRRALVVAQSGETAVGRVHDVRR